MNRLLEKDVQGVATYFEFRKAGTTIQIIVTPDGFTEDNSFVPATFFRRQLFSAQPKKRWKLYGLGHPGQDIAEQVGVEQDFPGMGYQIAESNVQRANRLSEYFIRLYSSGFELIGDKPLYIEISKEDLTLIRKMDTPTKIINRIKNARAAAGFPEAIVSE